MRRLAATAAVFGLATWAFATATALGPGIDDGASATERAVRGEQVEIDTPPQPATATYRVSFNARWTAASHPTTTPNDAHFSNPVLAVHSAPGAMFDLGAATSPGAANYDAGTSGGDNFGVSGRTGPGVVSGPVDPGFIRAAAENPFATITIGRTG